MMDFSSTELSIFRNQRNNICIKQSFDDSNDYVDFVEITPSMVDIVCKALKQVKDEIESEEV